MLALKDRLKAGPFLMDGAMGTQLQAASIPSTAWDNAHGCNEILNLSIPEIIQQVHQAYFQAGSDAVETNTFGASTLVLSEYGLASKTKEINRAAVAAARRAAREMPDRDRFIFGSLGPGTKLPSLGQVSFNDLKRSYQPQLEGLLEEGVDGIIIETCQDPLQVKAALDAIFSVVANGKLPPIYVSITIEASGSMLVGTNIQAITATLEPYPLDILGLNCAMGPKGMKPHLSYLKNNWARPIACMPNAGMPELKGEDTIYPLGPEKFAQSLGQLVRECGLSVAGGCCGTSPQHIKALAQNLSDYQILSRKVLTQPRAASLFDSVDLDQNPKPLFIGERGNATGSLKFRDALLKNNYDRAREILVAQEEKGAHLLDLSCAYAGRNEEEDLTVMVTEAVKECRAPLVLDSTSPEALEQALKLYGGRAVINSVNLEGGEQKALQIIRLAKRFGAILICLCIDEEGMAQTPKKKAEVAQRLVELCQQEGLNRSSLMVDPLTFSVASGDPEFSGAAMATIKGLNLIKQQLPGIQTVIGLSNVSFGLKGPARKALNALFLKMCLKQGLDACIVNIAALGSLTELDEEVENLGLSLLENQGPQGEALQRYLDWFNQAESEPGQEKFAQETEPRQRLHISVLKGRKDGLAQSIKELSSEIPAEEILNNILVPAMQEVGKLFNDGSLQLPFVLKSAEVMKTAVDLLQPLMKSTRDDTRQCMVLATVAGDVHDIGKNLVKIILANNGIKVIDLGTKVAQTEIINAIKKYQPDVLGLSGLLVKSVATMAQVLAAMDEEGLNLPVLLGGAALTDNFVREHCQPIYPGPVIYCRDAFDSLSYLREGKIRKEVSTIPSLPKAKPLQIDQYPSAPIPPFWGDRLYEKISLPFLLNKINRRRLMIARWKFEPGNLSRLEHEKLLNEKALPILENFLERLQKEDLIKLGGIYGFYSAHRQDNSLIITVPQQDKLTLKFPRQPGKSGGALVDFFRSDQDVVGFLAASAAPQRSQQDLEEGRYSEYFFLYGLAVELVEVLADQIQQHMINGLLGEKSLGSRTGERFGFGYPVAPDLEMNRIICELLDTARIGLQTLDSGMLTPEASVVALVAHHPQARHF